MNVTEILDSLCSLDENDLKNVKNKVDKLLEGFKEKSDASNLKIAIEIGDKICDYLHLNAFPYSYAIQAEDFPYDYGIDHDIYESFEMEGLSELAALCNNTAEIRNLCANFISLLPNKYLSKEEKGGWQVRTFMLYKKGGIFYKADGGVRENDLK